VERGGWLTGNCVGWYKRVLAEFIIRRCGERDLRWFFKIWVECKAKRANLPGGRGAKPQVRSGWLGYRLGEAGMLLFGEARPKSNFV